MYSSPPSSGPTGNLARELVDKVLSWVEVRPLWMDGVVGALHVGGHAEDGSTVVDIGWWIPHCSLVPDDPRSLLLSTRLSHAVKWSGGTGSAAESATTTSTAGTRTERGGVG